MHYMEEVLLKVVMFWHIGYYVWQSFWQIYRLKLFKKSNIFSMKPREETMKL